MPGKFRVFATCDIGEALDLLRKRGYDVETYPKPEPPPKSIIVEKVKSGIDGLITTLRDKIDAEVFEAGRGSLKVVAQYAVGFDNISRAEANRCKIPFTNTPDVLTETTAEFAFFMMGPWPAACGAQSISRARTNGATGILLFRSWAMKSRARQSRLSVPEELDWR